MCAVFELISSFIPAKLSAVQQQDVFTYTIRKQSLYSRIITGFFRDENPVSGFYRQADNILEFLDADGIAFTDSKIVHAFGKTPDETAIQELVFWLQSAGGDTTYQENHLSGVFEPAQRYTDIASGILILPVHRDRGTYILAFRPEAVQKLNWGGNPSEAVQFEADKKNYHPRNSFRLWQQIVKQTSLPWDEEELVSAEQFRNFVAELTLNKVYS
jgi:light-regulated signal transduction histidine kinase (bacteriophytochrome)